MPGITGQGTTFNLPNYVGELFRVSPEDTPFLSSIGGLTGGRPTTSTIFTWSGYDLRDADTARQRLEGANAQTAEARSRFQVSNVVEIHQETVETSYTKQAATGQFAGTGSSHPNAGSIAGLNAVGDEHSWQIAQVLKQIARDVEATFIRGTFQEPADNATARKTRGILAATTTNVATGGGAAVGTAVIEADDETFTISAHGMANGKAVTLSSITGGAVGVVQDSTTYYVRDQATNTFKLATKPNGTAIAFATDGGAVVTAAATLTEAMVLDLLQTVWEQGGIQTSETATVMVNGTLKRALTKIFITDKGFQEQSRDVGGVHVMTIETDFGRLNIMLNRWMPTSVLEVVSLEECAPRFLAIPGMGFLFQEPLAKVGAADRSQIYGEVGLEYGNEKAHGKLTGVTLDDNPLA